MASMSFMVRALDLTFAIAKYHGLMRGRGKTWIVLAAALGIAVWLALPYAVSAAFILDLTGSSSWARRLLPARVQVVTARDLQVPTRHGSIPARLYTPAAPAARSVIVFPGIHPGGVDEPRLAAFSSRLAATGMRVLSVPLPDLREFRITERSTDMIEDATAWMAGDHELSPSGRVSMAAISFAGGLALVAAGRPGLAGKVQVVISIGGHADLPRVLTYLCTGRLADGRSLPSHDYGVTVMLLRAVDRLVPPAQAEPLRRAVLTFLMASGDAGVNQARADRGFDDARRQGEALADPARTLMQRVNARDVSALGAALLPFVEDFGGAASLSPDRSPATTVPVFLLHGTQDNLIPSEETPLLAGYLHAHGNARVTWLVTPWLTHAYVQEDAPAVDAWRLVRFWTAMMGAAK
jgi:dienelactone hydrolase